MSSSYTAEDILYLVFPDSLRKRPHMYIGHTNDPNHLAEEVLANSVDEVFNGKCNRIIITFHSDLSFSVKDNGRGIPFGLKSGINKNALELIFTEIHSGGKFDNKAYNNSAGTHGVGLSAVSALSKKVIVEVEREGKKVSMIFEKGYKTSDLKEIGTSNQTGTFIRFYPDEEIFTSVLFNKQPIIERIKELSFLLPSVKLEIIDEVENEKYEFLSDMGLKGLLKEISPSEKIIHFKNQEVDICFNWTNNEQEKFLAYTNNVKQEEGGTHVDATRNSIKDVILDYIEKFYKESVLKKLGKDFKIIPEDIRAGLRFVIMIKIQDPKFSSQVKAKLTSNEARGKISDFLKKTFFDYLEKNPTIGREIVNKVLENAERREYLNKAKKELKFIPLQENSIIDFGGYKDNSEVFIVEGKSAGGSGRQGKSEDQYIFDLKGKPLNIVRKENIANNEEFTKLSSFLGIDIKTGDISRLKYKKIILLTDADEDGKHIKCLLMNFFLQFFPDIIKNGYLYTVLTPLFKVNFREKSIYVKDVAALDDLLINRFLKNYTLDIKNFKEFLSNCYRFVNYIKNLNIGSIDLEILSLNLIYDDISSIINEKFDGADCSVKIDDKNIYISITSIYGKNNYFYDKNVVYSNNFKDFFPLFFNEEKLYEPISFIEVFEKLSRKGIVIQRFKGLGEMNPNELRETCMEPEKRVLFPFIFEESKISDVQKLGRFLLGTEDKERKNFILSRVDLLDDLLV